MNKAFIYVRCSHLDSEHSGLGMIAQEKAARHYLESAQQRGIIDAELVDVLKDKSKSAYKIPLFHRPQGQRLIHLLGRGDHVIFGRMDRAFRSVKDFCNVVPMWLSQGITPHFADKAFDMGSANGRLMAHLIVAVAEWESAIKSERTKEALAARKAQGRPVNSETPTGHRRTVRGNIVQFVPDEYSMSIIEEVYRLRTIEKLSFDRISDAIEVRLSEYEGRPYKKRSAWIKRDWGTSRCQRAYCWYARRLATQRDVAALPSPSTAATPS